ncbi:hypothetical protein Taro_014529 [Colocasia esculenta]|uniref:PsbP C-terminal domain-containing protein n=1 Tax=Colocasia esculenta TaxID=4460 RepID=A0A843UET7_COLES|nr:hypothetical protein [Colocasia esculenta]
MTKGWWSIAPAAPSRGLLWRAPSRPLFLLPFLTPRRPPVPLSPPPPNDAPGFISAASCSGEGGGRPSAVSCSLGSGGAGRRNLILLLGSSLSFSALPTPVASPSLAAEEEEAGKGEPLERYTDKGEGFTLLRPASWLKEDKAGATALFVDESNKGNNIGVVVNPVRLSSLRDFGTPEFVADKLIQAERRKESTRDAQMVRVAERAGHAGCPVYEFEYTVDSTRGGLKRIFSAAFVDAKKLHLLNIAHSDGPGSPLESKTRMVLERVLHSFDAV